MLQIGAAESWWGAASILSVRKTLRVDAPEVSYARSGDTNVAYAVVGEGPFDLVLVGGWIVSNLDVAWEGPAADFFTRLATFSRLILFDKRAPGSRIVRKGLPTSRRAWTTSAR